MSVQFKIVICELTKTLRHAIMFSVMYTPDDGQ
jgi:hypothetical protein